MAKNLSASKIVVEIDGNEYHLPSAMTPRLRGAHGKLEEAYLKARNAELRTSFEPQTAEDAAGVAKGDEKYQAARRKTAEAARAFVAALLTTVDGQPAPDGIGDSINDSAANDTAAVLADGGELDPSSAT